MENRVNETQGSRRVTLSEEVANGIISDIVSGVLLPGDQVPKEADLMERFGVGRGTVREAVKTLVSRNVLEIHRAKGTFVCETPGVSEDPMGFQFFQDKIKTVADLLEIRTVLERFSAEHAAIHATAEQISHMKEIIYDAENSDDDEINILLDFKLHKYIAESSGNSVISTIIPIIQKNVEDFNNLDFNRDWARVNRGHRAMVDAIEAHDPERAAQALEQHLTYARERLKRMRDFENI